MNNQAKKLVQIEALDNNLATAKVQNLSLEEMTFIKGGSIAIPVPTPDELIRDSLGGSPKIDAPALIKNLPYSGGGSSTDSPSDSGFSPLFGSGWISL